MIGQIFNRKKLHRRTAIFITLKLLFFTIIISRLYKLQVIDSKKYKTLADENRIKLMIRMPERGKIYDDNGSIIASNKIHYSLKMTPGQIDDLNSVIVKLNSYIDLETEEVELIKNVYPQAEIRKHMPGNSTAISIEKAKRILGWDPKTTWRDA